MPLIINRERVEDAEIAREAQSLQRTFEQMPPELREERALDAAEFQKHLADWSKENVIERVLLRQRAAKDFAAIGEEAVEQALAGIKKQQGGEEQFSLGRDGDELWRDVETRLRLDRLIGEITKNVKPPKNKEVADYYRKHRAEFEVPEQVKAAHIVKNVDQKTDEAAALEVIQKAEGEIADGRPFEEVADQYSDCPGNGGDLGYFARGQMVAEFDAVVFSMEPGNRSPIFRTPFGFHIAKLDDKRPALTRNLQQMNDEIKEGLLQRKKTKAVEDFVDRLRAEAEIEEIMSAAGNVTARS
ncbi:MAG: peptidylprolyl isomerase [Acidobacteria bacterium]|nr:peptidylprolyl isomerase [Acidobacteriota bacterium]